MPRARARSRMRIMRLRLWMSWRSQRIGRLRSRLGIEWFVVRERRPEGRLFRLVRNDEQMTCVATVIFKKKQEQIPLRFTRRKVKGMTGGKVNANQTRWLSARQLTMFCLMALGSRPWVMVLWTRAGSSASEAKRRATICLMSSSRTWARSLGDRREARRRFSSRRMMRSWTLRSLMRDFVARTTSAAATTIHQRWRLR